MCRPKAKKAQMAKTLRFFIIASSLRLQMLIIVSIFCLFSSLNK